MNTDREILERAVVAVAEQAAETDALVHEAVEVGLGGSAPLVIHAKMIRQELLRVKGDLERELGRLELDCASCGRRVHWVSGLGVRAPATGRTGSRHHTACPCSRKGARSSCYGDAVRPSLQRDLVPTFAPYTSGDSAVIGHEE